MQTLDVISVNIWQIIASLLNLLILFLLVKKFLFKPVNKILKERQDKIDGDYKAAETLKAQAEEEKKEYSLRLEHADSLAAEIMEKATVNAEKRGEKIVSDAKDKADAIIKRAEADSALELKKAEEGIKREIVNVSAALTEKMLDREINIDDHHKLINSFIEKIGDADGSDE